MKIRSEVLIVLFIVIQAIMLLYIVIRSLYSPWSDLDKPISC